MDRPPVHELRRPGPGSLLLAATQSIFTPTFASTTNLQSFPLNGGGTSRVSYHWLRRFGLACEISQLLGVRRARIIFFHIAAQSASRLLNGLKECSQLRPGGLTNAPQFKRFALGGGPGFPLSGLYQ